MFNFFKKSFSFTHFLKGDHHYYQSDDNGKKFLEFYKEVSPLAYAIKLIADNCASIPFVVKIGDKYDYNHEILKLLKNPNQYISGATFEESLISNHLLTGNIYLQVIGSVKPSSLESLRPDQITIQADSKGDPHIYRYSPDSASQLSFTMRDGILKNSELNTLYHHRNFNPLYCASNLYGTSELKACEIELDLYYLANIHNYALLKNQARPSGILTYKGTTPLDDSQMSSIMENLKQNLTGAANAGKTTMLTGNFDWIQLSQSIKDMDFASLYKRVEESIIKTLHIPLPVISSDTMTLSNMDSSRLIFYENCVLPVKDLICDFLTAALSPFYKNQITITYDKAEIAALKPREINNALEISKAGILTRDEIREALGYPALGGIAGSEVVGTKQPTPTELKDFAANLKDRDGNNIYDSSFIQIL